MTEGEENRLKVTIEKQMEVIGELEKGQRLLSGAMMKLIGRVADLERKTTKPKSKLVGLNGHPMNG